MHFRLDGCRLSHFSTSPSICLGPSPGHLPSHPALPRNLCHPALGKALKSDVVNAVALLGRIQGTEEEGHGAEEEDGVGLELDAVD